MATFKKYWFAMNRDTNKQHVSGKCPDSIEATKTLITTPTTNLIASPMRSSDCKKILEAQYSSKSSVTEASFETKVSAKPIVGPDLSKINTSSSMSLASDGATETTHPNILQKSTNKSDKKPNPSDTSQKPAVGKEASSKTTTSGSVVGAKKKDKVGTTSKEPVLGAPTAPTAGGKADVKYKSKADATSGASVVGEKTTPKAGGKADAKKKGKVEEAIVGGEKTPATSGKTGAQKKVEAAATSNEPVKSGGTQPVVDGKTDTKTKGKRAETSEEPVISVKRTPSTGGKVDTKTKGKGIATSEEPVAGIKTTPTTSGKADTKMKGKGAATSIEPVKGVKTTPTTGGKAGTAKKDMVASGKPVTGKEKTPPSSAEADAQKGRIPVTALEQPELITTKSVYIEDYTPMTTMSSLSLRRQKPEKRIPFSRPINFSSRASTVDSLSGYERHETMEHEEELQRAWRSVDSRLLKMLPTPMKTPIYLKDPPDLGFEGTLTSELRKEFVKKKLAAMKKSSLDVVRNNALLRFVQPKMNKCEILRKKHLKKETIMTTFFEQHYDLYRKPPFKTIRLKRKC